MQKRPIPRPLYQKVKKIFQEHLARNFNPQAVIPNSICFICKDLPRRYEKVFMEQMEKEGLIRLWCGSYCDSRYWEVEVVEALGRKIIRQQVEEMLGE